jgi:hypothetical protein
MTTRERSYRCPICRERIRTHKELKTHLLQRHDVKLVGLPAPPARFSLSAAVTLLAGVPRDAVRDMDVRLRRAIETPSIETAKALTADAA